MKFYLLVFSLVFFISQYNIKAEDGIYEDILDESFSIVPSESELPILKRLEYKKLSELPLESRTIQLDVTGFDRKIDEDKYILGTGDGLTIYIWGSINDQIKSIVDHEGNFIVPSLGSVNVRGLTLREGKEKIKEKVLDLHKKVEITVVLSEIRKFKVYILGEVSEPGGYIVDGATRVSDLIISASGIKQNKIEEKTLKLNEIDIDSISKIRAIEIENDDHQKRFADLAMFFNYNCIDRNYYLNEGDRIFVPKKKEIISVQGSVNYPGKYYYMIGDTLITVLKVAGGLTRDADSSRIILHRFVDNLDSLITFELSFADSSVFHFPIQKDDRVLVCGIPDYRKHREVIIEGEVKYPGIYPIQKDKTKFSEIITMAGGLTEDAFLRGSKIIRKIFTKVGDREFERLVNTAPENLSPLEKSYLKTKLIEEEGIISIDFEELLAKGNDFYDIILRDKDKITIARKNLSIKVTGAVISPGLVNYKEGADYKYYIEQAGGVNTRARKGSIAIIKGGTDVMLKPNNVKNLEAGDAIWVPERGYVNKFNLVRDILLIAGSIATLVISAFTINRFANPE